MTSEIFGPDQHDLVGVLTKVRSELSDSDRPPAKLRRTKENAEKSEATTKVVQAIREAIKRNLNPKALNESLLQLLEKHIVDFPEEPRDGFASLEEFINYHKQINQILAEEKAIFNLDPERFLRPDPESPGQKKYRILVECADGRNSIALHLPRKELLSRFGIRWLPFAGLIIFPDFPKFTNLQEFEKLLEQDDVYALMMNRMDYIFGESFENGVKMLEAGKIAHLHFEFQSHFDHDCAEEGCGAHNSDLAAAQMETLKNCLIAEEWIKRKYGKYYQEGKIRLYRTVHNTGEHGDIHQAVEVEKEQGVDWSKRIEDTDLTTQRFKYPKNQTEEGVVRPFQGNPLGAETEKHYEQAIRVSNYHFAHTLIGQSTLEISWTDSFEILYAHLKKLSSIVRGNFLKSHPDKPLIIHFDVDNSKKLKTAAMTSKLKAAMKADPDFADLLAAEKLLFYVTVTDGLTYESKEP